MSNTSLTVYEVAKMSQRGPVTRALVANEVVRWKELTRNNLTGQSLEPAGTGTSNLVGQKSSQIPLMEVRIPRVKKVDTSSKGNYILLKKYDGYITARDENTFTARLYEKPSDYPVLESEFDLEELSEADRHLAIEGAPLVWTIGYHDEDARRRESLIYLRRRPSWSEKEIDQAKQAVSELTRDINWK